MYGFMAIKKLKIEIQKQGCPNIKIGIRLIGRATLLELLEAGQCNLICTQAGHYKLRISFHCRPKFTPQENLEIVVISEDTGKTLFTFLASYLRRL